MDSFSLPSPPFIAPLAENPWALALPAPSSPESGLAVVWPRRPVASWSDLSRKEQMGMLDLAEEVRALLVEEGRLGDNPGSLRLVIDEDDAAPAPLRGVALHLLSRDRRRAGGDAQAGRAPSEAGPRRPRLHTPRDEDFWLALLHHFGEPAYDRIDLLVSFVMRSGIRLVSAPLDSALDRGARVRLLTSDYLDVTDPDALQWFLDRKEERGDDRLAVRLFRAVSGSFHPKAYLFRSSQGHAAPVAFVGSSNLSRSALVEGVEWNVLVHDVEPLHDEFERLWTDPNVIDLDLPWLEGYRSRRRSNLLVHHALMTNEATMLGTPLAGAEPAMPPPTPNEVQREALAELARTRREGYRAALAVLATGLGKTFLAAFDSRDFGRVLFVAHRVELLRQARDTFRLIRPGARMTMAVDGVRDLSGAVVFASVMTLARALEEVDPRDFDYVVVDEFHHADAPTYRRMLGHLRPRFLLGLTATPERMDGGDLVSLCQDNVLHICDLARGIRCGYLAPFRYRGVQDVVDYDEIPFSQGQFDIEELTRAVSTEERARLAHEEWRRCGASTVLGFCTSTRHADFMADWFGRQGVRTAAVHSGETSADRDECLERLRLGQIEVLFAVDLFNEGLDVPHLDGVLMLRPTESPVIFLQQLGRGLRWREGKVLQVVDLVANHRTFLKKAVVLAETLSGRVLDAGGAVGYLTAPVDLPDGVSLDIGEIHGLLEQLVARGRPDPFAQWVADWTEEYGARPRALDGALVGRFPVKGRPWLGQIQRCGALSPAEVEAWEGASDLLSWIERLPGKQKSFAIVAAGELIRLGGLEHPIPFEALAGASHRAVLAHAGLRGDLAGFTEFDWQDPDAPDVVPRWRTLLSNWLAGEKSGGPRMDAEDRVALTPPVPPADVGVVASLCQELLEARMWLYISQQKPIFRNDDGREIEAHFEVTPAGSDWRVTLAARGGKRGTADQLNLHYDEGYTLFLERLKRVRGTIVDAYVGSSVTASMPLESRRLLPADRLPLAMTEIEDVPGLRSGLSRAAVRVRPEGSTAKGGNHQKRVTFHVAIPGLSTRREIEQYLSFGTLES